MVDWQYIRDFTRKHVNDHFKIRWNSVRFPRTDKGEAGWSAATIDTTAALAALLAKNNVLFATEVRMSNGRRADILCPLLYDAQVIEIYDSESVQSLKEKRADYAADGLTVLELPARPEQATALLEEKLK